MEMFPFDLNTCSMIADCEIRFSDMIEIPDKEIGSDPI